MRTITYIAKKPRAIVAHTTSGGDYPVTFSFLVGKWGYQALYNFSNRLKTTQQIDNVLGFS